MLHLDLQGAYREREIEGAYPSGERLVVLRHDFSVASWIWAYGVHPAMWAGFCAGGWRGRSSCWRVVRAYDRGRVCSALHCAGARVWARERLCAFGWWPRSFTRASRTPKTLGPGGAPTPQLRAGLWWRSARFRTATSLSHTRAVEMGPKRFTVSASVNMGPLPHIEWASSVKPCVLSLRNYTSVNYPRVAPSRNRARIMGA